MLRLCDHCKNPYEAKRKTSRFCSTNCRVKNNGRPAGELLPASIDDLIAGLSMPLVMATAATLTNAGRLDTYAGQQALLIAGKIGSPMDTGSSTAALSKELSRIMAEALEGVASTSDSFDELRTRRDRKLAAG